MAVEIRHPKSEIIHPKSDIYILMQSFNIRVYGILINKSNQVLLSDEFIRGHYYTKFPGGGLEFGEGTRDCLKREFMEEMGLRVEVGDHLYTTDFFQLSAFHPGHQILSIYYRVRALEEITVRLSSTAFDFDERQMLTYHATAETESFRFINWDELSEETVSLPIDKIVVGMLKKNS
jgi:ADP-ribose pyrophosphatase YjhB (NUDIX family)